VDKEIREALLGLPNGRIEGVSVEYMEKSGHIVSSFGPSATPANSEGSLGASDKFVTMGSAASTSIDNDFRAGDMIRIEDELRRVEGVDAANKKLFINQMFAADHDSKTYSVFKQNTMRYRIKFESGCTQDAHCNSNGVDETDSDSDAICSLGGICRCSDDAVYHGYGCTRTGKGDHSRPYRRSNSGDLPPLICDKSSVFSGMVITTPVHVKRTAPTKVEFEEALAAKDNVGQGTYAVGQEIYIDGQKRTVVNVGTNYLQVDEPFYEYDQSDSNNIVPTRSWSYLIDRDGGIGIECHASDLMRISNTIRSGRRAGGMKRTGTDERELSMTNHDGSAAETGARSFDEHDVHIGDRLRIDLTDGAEETRTVDAITYANGGSATTQKSLIQKIHLDSKISTTANNVAVYVDMRGTTENRECSDRGLCDQSTGICECFQGYTDDDCSRQDALNGGS